MKKELYIKPEIITMESSIENLMITASPGVGGDYDPNLPIEAKPQTVFEEEDIEPANYQNYSVWGD